MLGYVLYYVCLVLGVPGNIVSAIVWLRRHVTSNNSSALYLAVLAINDTAYFLIATLFREALPAIAAVSLWLYQFIFALQRTISHLEPLLVLAFSVERLIAISCPLQVCCIPLYHYHYYCRLLLF